MQILNFIGRGSAFNTKEGNTSAYMKQEEDILLIDCGENVFTRILELNLLKNVENIYVIITHLHPDHVGSLGTLIFYCYYIKKIKVNLIFENTYELAKFLKIQGVSSSIYNITNCEKLQSLKKLNVLQIKARKVQHTCELNCFGYNIKFIGEKQIFYAGDTNNIEKDLIYKLEKNIYDQIYVDTCLADYPGNTHLPLRKLCKLIPKELRNKVFCMHLDCTELIHKAELEGFNIANLF